jgi:hypothetical protein
LYKRMDTNSHRLCYFGENGKDKMNKYFNFFIFETGLRQRKIGAHWGPFLTSPLGANFDRQGLLCPLGMKLSPRGEVIP